MFLYAISAGLPFKNYQTKKNKNKIIRLKTFKTIYFVIASLLKQNNIKVQHFSPTKNYFLKLFCCLFYFWLCWVFVET